MIGLCVEAIFGNICSFVKKVLRHYSWTWYTAGWNLHLTNIEGLPCQMELRLHVTPQTHCRLKKGERETPANQLSRKIVAALDSQKITQWTWRRRRVDGRGVVRFLGTIPVMEREGTAGEFVCVCVCVSSSNKLPNMVRGHEHPNMSKCVCGTDRVCVLDKVAFVLYWCHLMLDLFYAFIQKGIKTDLCSRHIYFINCSGHLRGPLMWGHRWRRHILVSPLCPHTGCVHNVGPSDTTA